MWIYSLDRETIKKYIRLSRIYTNTSRNTFLIDGGTFKQVQRNNPIDSLAMLKK